MAPENDQANAAPRPSPKKPARGSRASGFFERVENERLVEAIAAAERDNRGEVRLHLEQRCPYRQSLPRARQLFGKFGMHKTRDDTGVLLYVAVKDRTAAVFAGAGIHGSAKEGFWQQVIDEVATGFKSARPVSGLLKALDRIGELLREYAPGDDSAGDELPNKVTTS